MAMRPTYGLGPGTLNCRVEVTHPASVPFKASKLAPMVVAYGAAEVDPN
jgi:hypothetical protein